MSLAWRITAPQAHTVLHVGTGRCSDQTPDIQRRGFSHPWGCSTQWTIPSWWAGSHLKLKGLPQLISASLLHIKPKPREIICHGIWGNQASYIRGGLDLSSSPWMQPSRVHCTKPLERLDTSTCSFPFKWFWLSETHVIPLLSNIWVFNPRFIWHKCLL